MSISTQEQVIQLRKIWHAQELLLDDKYKIIRNELIELLETIQDPFIAYLLYDKEYKLKSRDNFYLHVFLKKHFKNDFNRLYSFISVLDRIIEVGNQQGIWDLCRLQIPVKSKREKGIFTPERFKYINLNTLWIKHLHNSIELGNDLSDEAELGQLLFSGILNGGLINTSSIYALLQAIEKPLVQHNNRSFLELYLGWQGHAQAELRRWFPDILTELLLLSFQKKQRLPLIVSQDKGRQYAWKGLKTFFRESELPKQKWPKNITTLFDIATIRYQLHLPPFIVKYLNRSFFSHSLSNQRYKRLFENSKNEYSTINELNLEKWRNKTFSEDNISDNQYPWLEPLKTILVEKNTTVLKKNLKSLLRNKKFSESTIEGLLARWALHLLTSGTLAKNIPKLSTVRSYISSLGWRLSSTFNAVNVFSLNDDAFEEFYIQILEDTENVGARRKLARMLREFHLFLVKNYHLPEIDISHTLGNYSSRVPVDANIITHDEYKQILSVINNSDLSIKHPDISVIIQLLIILGFRCGTRRNEALKLRLIDIQEMINPVLLIRPHSTRMLKSKSSTRSLPLIALLEQEEIDLLIGFVKKRREQEKNNPYSDYLFSVPDKKYAFLPEELAFDAIHKAMRYVTSDEKAKYHHLRHSFASWILFRFILSEYELNNHHFASLPETTKWLHKGKDFHKTFYHNEFPTRRHLYAVTGLLGHASPEITLEHYIHNLDILSHYFIENEFSPPTANVLAMASKINLKTYYRWLDKENGMEYFRERIYKKNNIQPLINSDKVSGSKNLTSLSFSDFQFERNAWVSIQNIWKLIYSHFEHAIEIPELAERYAMTESEVFRIIVNAQCLSELKSNNSRKSSRFKLMYSKISGKSLHCPFLQNKTYYLETAEHMAESLLTVSEGDENIIHRGIRAYIEHAWSTRKLVAFNSFDKANDFLTLINHLDLSNLKIDYSHLVEKTYTSLSKRKVNKILGEKNGAKFQTLHINLYNKNKENLNQAFRYVFFLYACMEYDDIMNLN